MTTARDRIFDKIEERLTAIPGIGSVEVMPTGDPDTFDALEIYDNGQRPAETEAGTTRYDLRVAIVGYVQGDGGKQSHQLLNALHAAVITALITEPPLGGLAETIDEGDLDVNLAPLAQLARQSFEQDILITYATPRGDPA